jgi:hypothetical protein
LPCEKQHCSVCECAGTNNILVLELAPQMATECNNMVVAWQKHAHDMAMKWQTHGNNKWQ